MISQEDRFQTWGWKKRLALKLFLILGGVLAGFFIAEVALRLAGYDFPEFYREDWDRGNSLKPGVEGWYRKEGKAYIRINSDGLRDIEHSKQKPAGTRRIAVIGDSYAEALQVPLDNTFWHVMEQKLRECKAFGQMNIEVINFGVSGYGTAQELLTLRQQAWAYSPDIVMLAVTTNNDISDNSRALKRTDQIPYFVYRDGQLVLDNSFRQTLPFRFRESFLGRLSAGIVEHVRVLQAIRSGLYALRHIEWRRARNYFTIPGQLHESASESKSDRRQVTGEELGIENAVYLVPSNQVWNEAWRVTEGLIRLMHRETRSCGAQFLVVTLSNSIQVFPRVKARQRFMKQIGASDLFYPDQRIRALCEREGIPVITLAPALRTYAEQHQAFLHGFDEKTASGHWNTLGHRVAGEMIAQEMCQGLAK